MKIVFLILYFLSLLSCTDQSRPPEPPSILMTKPILDHHFLNVLNFSGSVETEILKLVQPSFKQHQKIPSQLKILSQILDLHLNKKTKNKSSDIFINCSKIKIHSPKKNTYEIVPVCEKNSLPLAIIFEKEKNIYIVEFKQSEWKSVIGDSVILNQKDKICKIVISNNKLNELTCENTLINTGSSLQLEEIKIEKYEFYRQGSVQIRVQGGRYKDFIKRSSINIIVPDSGKIDFKEDEILIKDEFE